MQKYKGLVISPRDLSRVGEKGMGQSRQPFCRRGSASLKFAFRIIFGGLFLFLLIMAAGGQAAAETAVVVDDKNNLRARGGPASRQAPILMVLNRGDYVRVSEHKGKWAQVSTPEDVNGWISSRFLKPAPNLGKPQPLPANLRAKLADFLSRLRSAVKSRQFAQLAPLLEPRGVFLQGRLFPDAARNPKVQRPQVSPLWYATDVSLTLGTAWELLMAGTDPPRLKLGFDPSTDSWGILKPGMKSDFVAEAQKDQALFPGHLKALALAPRAQLVMGFPEKIAGVPESDHYTEDPTTLPFTWVYRVGKDRYRLEPIKGIGLILVVTDRPGQGMRLRAVITYGS